VRMPLSGPEFRDKILEELHSISAHLDELVTIMEDINSKIKDKGKDDDD